MRNLKVQQGFCRFIPQAILDLLAIRGVPNTSSCLSFSQRFVHIMYLRYTSSERRRLIIPQTSFSMSFSMSLRAACSACLLNLFFLSFFFFCLFRVHQRLYLNFDGPVDWQADRTSAGVISVALNCRPCVYFVAFLETKRAYRKETSLSLKQKKKKIRL